MKKIVLLVVLALTIAVISFGQDFKLGFGGGILGEFGLNGGYDSKIDILGTETTTDASVRSHSLGGFLFFDATYTEASLSFLFGMPQNESTVTTKDSSGTIINNAKNSSWGTVYTLELGLLGKYPFYLGRLTVYPLLGLNYMFVLYAEAHGVSAKTPSDGNALGFQGGAGSDFSLTEKLYLRGELLYSIKLPNKTERDAAEGGAVKFGQGVRIKFGVGYSF